MNIAGTHALASDKKLAKHRTVCRFALPACFPPPLGIP